MYWGGIRYGARSNFVLLIGDPNVGRGGVNAVIYLETLQEYLPIILDYDTIFM
jgi:hypothetical protein